MNPRTALLPLLLLGALPLPLAAADEAQQLAAEARAIIGVYATRLQQELQAAIAAGGLEHAIGVCRTEAPSIAAELGGAGWSVGRTSLKPRNPSNAPDEFERRVLLDFESRLAEGRAADTLGYYQWNEAGPRGEFRYMKAIETRELCLGCHGSSIAPAVAARLDELYPGDPARGYAIGDLRGAFTLTRQFTGPAME